MAIQIIALRPHSVCEHLGISISTFWRLVKSGQLKTVKVSPRCTAVMRTDLDAYLESLK